MLSLLLRVLEGLGLNENRTYDLMQTLTFNRSSLN